MRVSKAHEPAILASKMVFGIVILWLLERHRVGSVLSLPGVASTGQSVGMWHPCLGAEKVGGMNGWLVRITRNLADIPIHASVHGLDDDGVDEIAAGLARLLHQSVRLDLRSGVAETELPGMLVRAIELTHPRARLKAQHGIDRLVRQLAGMGDVLGGLTLIVTGVENADSLLKAVQRTRQARPLSLKVVGFTQRSDGLNHLDGIPFQRVQADDLCLEPAEIEAIVEELALTPSQARRLKQLSQPNLTEVRAALAALTADTPDLLVGVSQSVVPRAMRPPQAVSQSSGTQFAETAAGPRPAEALGLIPAALNEHALEGTLDVFAARLWALHRRMPEDDDVLAPLLRVLAHEGSHEDMEAPLRERLSMIRPYSPVLASAYAEIFLPGDALDHAERALTELRTADTLSSYGFVATHAGHVEDALPALLEARERYQGAGRTYRALEVACHIAWAHYRLGAWRRTVLWAERVLDELDRRGAAAFGVRKMARQLVAEGLLMLDDAEGARARWSDQRQAHAPPVHPGLGPECDILDGDLARLGGRLEDALDAYERAYRKVLRRRPGRAAKVKARGLLAAGRDLEAEAVIRVAQDVRERVAPAERAQIDAAALMVDASLERLDVHALERLTAHPDVQNHAYLRIELVMLHVAVLQRAKQTTAMQAVIDAYREDLAPLGLTAWTLLAPPFADTAALHAACHSREAAPPQLRVLGGRRLIRNGRSEALSVRQAELLTILAQHPEGLSGPRLLDLMYGENGRMTTLKALVSRTRSLIGIESQPYALSEVVEADFDDVLNDLDASRVRQATERYVAPLLPESDAPAVNRIRETLEARLRHAVLSDGDATALVTLAQTFDDDLELWEAAEVRVSQDHPSYPVVQSEVRRVRADWGVVVDDPR